MKKFRKKTIELSQQIYTQKDKFWLTIWFSFLGFVAIWNIFFLNKPALKLVIEGFINTLVISILVVIFSFLIGWVTALLLVRLE